MTAKVVGLGSRSLRKAARARDRRAYEEPVKLALLRCPGCERRLPAIDLYEAAPIRRERKCPGCGIAWVITVTPAVGEPTITWRKHDE